MILRYKCRIKGGTENYLHGYKGFNIATSYKLNEENGKVGRGWTVVEYGEGPGLEWPVEVFKQRTYVVVLTFRETVLVVRWRKR